MRFPFHFPTVLSSTLAATANARPTYWGPCPHCEQTTPWFTNAFRGDYRCTECGRSVLGDTQ